jgi:hypothetical protein
MNEKKDRPYRIRYIVGNGKPEYETVTRMEALNLIAFKRPIRENFTRTIESFPDKGNKFKGRAINPAHLEAIRKAAVHWRTIIECEGENRNAP